MEETANKILRHCPSNEQNQEVEKLFVKYRIYNKNISYTGGLALFTALILNSFETFFIGMHNLEPEVV